MADTQTQNNTNDLLALDLAKKHPQYAENIEQFLAGVNREHEERQVEAQAYSFGIGYINLVGYPFRVDDLSALPKNIVLEAGIIPFEKQGKKVKIATTNPSDSKIIKILEEQEEKLGYDFDIHLASSSSVRYAQKIYEMTVRDEQSDKIKISVKNEISFDDDIKSLDELKAKITKVSVTKIVDILLAGAVKANASDIHIEPEEKDVRVRFRIDGVLHEIINISKEMLHPIDSRIKFISSLKLDITDVPQDGKFTFSGNDIRFDVRVSVIPSAWGETFVLRLLNQTASFLEATDLGMQKNDFEKLSAEIKKTKGLILITGPTGSGKTTSLYAMLHSLNKPEVKIVTLEDPIEYQIPGIVQSQIKEDEGFTFASGLRSLLRQDPDIMMIGEIRDLDTAEMAINAALTGHLVFSTLHTNDVAGAYPRLVDMGVKNYLLGGICNLLIAQRLVRKVCNNCRESYVPDESTLKKVKSLLGNITNNAKEIKVFYKGKGCNKCNNTGFKGRVGIFEVMEPTEKIEALVLANATPSEIKKQAIAEGMTTMEQDGILKALAGITTLDEVWRVISEEV